MISILIILVDDNDGIIDEQAERYHKARHRHLMQRHACEIKQDQHTANGQRQRHANHDCGAPTHHQKQDQKHDERRIAEVLCEIAKTCIGVLDLIERDINRYPARRTRLHRSELFFRGGCPIVHTYPGRNNRANEDRPRVVDRRELCLRICNPFGDRRDIANTQGRAIGALDQRHIPNTRGVLESAINLYADIRRTGSQLSCRRFCISASNNLRSLPEPKPCSGQRGRIDFNLYLFCWQSVDLRLFRARQGRQQQLNVLCHTRHDSELSCAVFFPCERDDNGRCAKQKALNAWLADPVWQLSRRLLDLRTN